MHVTVTVLMECVMIVSIGRAEVDDSLAVLLVMTIPFLLLSLLTIVVIRVQLDMMMLLMMKKLMRVLCGQLRKLC